MSLLKKKIVKPLEYEVWVKVQCPTCILPVDTKKGKRILITVPARGLPDSIQCFNCGTMIKTKDLFKTGKEVQGLASNGEQIKGILC